MGERQWFVLYILLCLEMGIFLVLVPWSFIWERNYFLQVLPDLRHVLLQPAFRGAVSGLGLANIYLGLSEIARRRRAASETSTILFPGGFRVPSSAEAVDTSSESEEASDGVESASHALAGHEKRS